MADFHAMILSTASLGWLAPPDLPTADLRRQARALWLVSWPLLAVVALLLGVLVLVEPDTLSRRATTVSAVAGLVVVLHVLSRLGKPGVASWMLVVGLTVIVTQRAWITGGIHAPVAVFYLLFTVIAGVLLGARGAFITAATCVAGAVILTAGGMLGLLAPRAGAGSPVAGFVFVMLAIGLALAVQALISLQHGSGKLAPDAVRMFVHDMRSPIHVTLAHLEVLRETVNGPHTQHVEGALGGAATINRMTTNLLDVSRLDSGRLKARRAATDVTCTAHGVVEDFRILQAGREITVVSRGNGQWECDPDLTRRVIENLVSNAIKHTPREGRVVVSVTEMLDRLRIAVRDEGAGIPADRRATIFEPFSAEGLRSTAGFESSGLGLAFCRLAVEAQGGSISVEDALPRGSNFVVDLPR